MLAVNEANYGLDQSSIQFAPVSVQIIAQATKDSLGLSITSTPFQIDAANPPAIDTPVQIADTTVTPSRELPTAVVSIATATPRSTSEPNTPTPFPTTIPSPTQEIATVTATPTAVPTLPASFTPTNTATAVWPTPTFTATPQPTAPPPTSPPPTSPPTRTLTPPPPPPPFTPTATASATLPPTNTPSPTPTETPTPPPCSGSIPGGEPNIGPPNGTRAAVGCGQNIVVDLGAANAIVVTGSTEPAFDLVYYEWENPANNINLDWVIIEVSTSSSGPWVQVFNWGNDILDANTNIGQAGYGAGSEPDNNPIPFADLYGGNSPGIAIDIDAFAPAGTYQWLRIMAPLGGDNDAAEVDSVESLP